MRDHILIKLRLIAMNKLCLGVLMAFGLSANAYSYTFAKVDESVCVKALYPASGLPQGIVTDHLESGVFAQRCDGNYASVRLQNNQASLIATNNKVPSRLLTTEKTALKDSEVSSSKTIKAAWLTGSTDRYQHGILGDAIEASGLAVIDRSGKRYSLELDGKSVFEDRKVRIADLDQDGHEELIVVRAYLNLSLIHI